MNTNEFLGSKTHQMYLRGPYQGQVGSKVKVTIVSALTKSEKSIDLGICIPNEDILSCMDWRLQAQLKFVDRRTDRLVDG